MLKYVSMTPTAGFMDWVIINFNEPFKAIVVKNLVDMQ